jgi:hypothetical protein
LREIMWSPGKDGILRVRVRSCGELERICSVCGILGMELWLEGGMERRPVRVFWWWRGGDLFGR